MGKINGEIPIRFLKDFPEFGIKYGKIGYIVESYGWNKPVKNRKEVGKYKIYIVKYFDEEYNCYCTIIVETGDIKKHDR